MVTVFSNGPFTTRPEIRGTFGCAAATHWLAAATAMRILERGGNAFDAAAAAGFALQVVEPHLNGPAGEVPILFYDARTGKAEGICGQGVTPAAATPERFRELGLDMVPGTGHLAACVPGAFSAWLLLLRNHGTLRLKDVLEPAIELAGGGFPLTLRVARTIESMRALFESEWTSSAAVYFPGGKAPEAGALFRNPALAATYRRIVDESAGGSREVEIEKAEALWYEGFVAEAIDRAGREPVLDSSGQRHAGLLTADDLARWRASYDAPVSRNYNGATVLKCGAWTQGPAFLQWLGLLEGFPLGELDPLGDEFVHLVTETGKLALADRDAWLGDGDAPLAALLDPDYIAQRRQLVTAMSSAEFRPGAPGGRLPTPVPLQEAVAGDTPAGVGEPTFTGAIGEPTFASGSLAEAALAAHVERREGDTCHICVTDRFGNMVAATPSGGWLQASPVIPELGFGLSTRTQMFWLTPGLPSSLAPGKRPRTTLTPTLVLRDGLPYLGFGTPGGDQQEQWSMAFLLRVLHHGYGLQQAIDAPAFHTSHLVASFWPRDFKPRSLSVEGRFSRGVIEALEKRGHDVTVAGDWTLGRLCAVGRETIEGAPILRSAANPRGMQDFAVGR
ncbi:MAG: gamma-glutamyltransferase [Chelatococcus sp.]|uniref:gamma-glutamyltransferase family protein n=1 Tax=Chelatococcus sp. TaxID=1953771 RepID=UPI0025C6E102|nr:gamma-glutamyltransferase [Chelatococcus sp.]MBX3540615.1 gamma-glutamyltransferase [Chelatococcus sp.]